MYRHLKSRVIVIPLLVRIEVQTPGIDFFNIIGGAEGRLSGMKIRQEAILEVNVPDSLAPHVGHCRPLVRVPNSGRSHARGVLVSLVDAAPFMVAPGNCQSGRLAADLEADITSLSALI